MKKTANKISIFNLIKGIGMVLVIWFHVNAKFNNLYSPIIDYAVCVLQTFAFFSLMPVFFILSGYFTRKQTVEKYLKNQTSYFIKPYIVTASITTFLIFLRNVFDYHIGLQMLKATIKQALGFLLGVSPACLRYFGLQNTNCGPLWFLLALLTGTFILIWMLNHITEEKQLWFALGVSVLYIPLMLLEDRIPFSLIHGVYGFISLFIGYRVKKQKLLDRPLPKYHWILGVVCFILMYIVQVRNRDYDLFWAILRSYVGPYIAFLTIYLFCYFGDNDRWITDKLEYVGKNSLLFICVHTVEDMALPWWKLSNRFLEQPLLGMFLMFVMRVFLCGVGVFLILNRKMIWKKICKK